MNSHDDLAPVWKALADPTRRAILDALRKGPRTTGDLCGRFDVTRFAVMKHLAVLEDAGLVLARRQGRERWNHLNAASATDLILEPELGGRFYEVNGADGSSLWATVTGVQKDRELRLTGPLGMTGAVHGVVTFALEDHAGGTKLSLSHHVLGEV